MAQLKTALYSSKTSDGAMTAEKFAQLYDVYYKRVYKYICYRINNHYAAEDICSQVFEAVISKYHSFKPEKSSFEVWLFAIARNAVADYFRSLKKRTYFSLDSILDMVMSRPSPEEMMIRDDDNQALFAALAKLNDKERNIVAMKYAANLTNTVIADLLGISGSHVGVVLYRSLKKLHKELERGGFHL